MKIAASSAATNRSGWNTCAKPAHAVPTSTGATAAGSVRGRAAISQILIPLGIAAAGVLTASPPEPLSPPRELGEVGRPLLEVGVTALLRLFAHVEEEVRVVGQLLDPGEAILIGIEARLEHTERERRHDQHLAAPLDGLGLKLGERNDSVDEPHVERLLGVVLAAQKPDLL